MLASIHAMGLAQFAAYNPSPRTMIYLDNNATTQPLPEVVEAMVRSLQKGVKLLDLPVLGV